MPGPNHSGFVEQKSRNTENSPWRDLYSNHADRYDCLVQSEDYQGHLLAALRELQPMENSTIVEVGAGTGRMVALCLGRATRQSMHQAVGPQAPTGPLGTTRSSRSGPAAPA